MEPTTITFRTTEDVKKILDNMALEENRTLSNMIETIILKYLDSIKKNTQKWVFLCEEIIFLAIKLN